MTTTYNLSGNDDYFEVLSHNYGQLWKKSSPLFCDVTFEFGPGFKIRGTQSYLSSFSPFLRNIFMYDQTLRGGQSNPDLVVILDLTGQDYFTALKAVMELLYTGRSATLASQPLLEKMEHVIHYLGFNLQWWQQMKLIKQRQKNK